MPPNERNQDLEALAPAAEAALSFATLNGGIFTIIVGMALTVAITEIATGHQAAL